jgi:integrase
MATFLKRGDKYFVQIRRKGFPTACRSFHLKADAEEWARHMETKADRGDMPVPIKVLDGYKVRDIIVRYLNEVTVKKRSAATERYFLNAFLRTSVANLTLAQINASHFSTYREKRLKEIKPATLNRQLSVIRHAFEIAMHEWDIPLRENPLIKFKRLRVNDARNRRMEAEEWEAIKVAASVCRNPFIMPLIKLALETAMRRGELLALQWQHLDFKSRTLFIPHTKNGHSRTIPMTSEAINVLHEIQAMKADKKLVFSGLTGNAADHVWNRIMLRARIENLHFHDLRHEAITRFFERGLSVPEVALISGHRDFRMLFRYTHLKAEDIAEKLL